MLQGRKTISAVPPLVTPYEGVTFELEQVLSLLRGVRVSLLTPKVFTKPTPEAVSLYSAPSRSIRRLSEASVLRIIIHHRL